MKGHLLICDTAPELGGVLSRRFMNMGILAECCKYSLSIIQNVLADSDISGILIFSFSADEALMEFIRNNQKYGRKVFVGLYNMTSSAHELYLEAGAVRCFAMPCSFSNICRTVMLLIDSDESDLTQLEIFMEELGFSRRLKGFYYLAKAAEIALSDPERLWGGMTGIYEEVAQNYSTKASLVERAIRNLSAHVCESGVSAKLTNHTLTAKMNNTELICALCDRFNCL